MTFKEALLRRRVQFKTSPGDPAKIHICCPFCTSRGRSQDTQFKLCVHLKMNRFIFIAIIKLINI